MREHRFVVVVGKWIVEPWFDDLLDEFGRVAGGIDPHAGFPQSEVAQDAFDDSSIVDEGDDSHFMVAARAQERVGFPDFLDEFAPSDRKSLFGAPGHPARSLKLEAVISMPRRSQIGL